MRRALRIAVGGGRAPGARAGRGGWWAYGRLSRQPARARRPAAAARAWRAPVTVERDGLGIPTIRGVPAQDVARATGFLHAQDRFFQMDLARRRAAGELAALVGAAGASRSIGRRACTACAPRRARPWRCCRTSDRAVLEAYVGGVNAGLAGAGGAARSSTRCCARPRRRGAPRTACSWCCRCSSRCRTRTATTSPRWRRCTTCCRRRCSTCWRRRGTEWDAPVVGVPFETPAGAGAGGLQPAAERERASPRSICPTRSDDRRGATDRTPWDADERRRRARQQQLGGGGRADRATARALVANDMHLAIRVPNTWYRARARVARRGRRAADARARRHHAPGRARRSSPAATPTWPGASPTPTRTGRDLVLLELDPTDPNRYRTPRGLAALRRSTTRDRRGRPGPASA